LLENESKVIKNKSLYVGDMIKMDVPNKPRKRMTETPCHLDRSWFKSSQSCKLWMELLIVSQDIEKFMKKSKAWILRVK
jgi:hypothetical protein